MTNDETTAVHPRGERVWLRALERADLPDILAAVNSWEIGRWAGYATPLSLAGLETWFDRTTAQHGQGQAFFAISSLGARDVLGTVWLWNEGSRLDGLELSIYLTEAVGPGHGIGTDAVGAALDYAFGSLTVERIWLTTEAENLRARRAFEKAGLHDDGVIRHHFRRGGRWRDSRLLSILREEWEALPRQRSWDLAGPQDQL